VSILREVRDLIEDSRLDQLTEGWGKESRVQVKEILDKYGDPDEAGKRMLVWYNTGPWIYTIVYRDSIQHNWPMPHTDILEQAIKHDVPLDRYSDLVKYDGSVWAERTKGILAARCHFENMNFVAINLANDVITKKKTVAQARSAYEDAFKMVIINKKPMDISKGLTFKPSGKGDPDRKAGVKSESVLTEMYSLLEEDPTA